MWGADACFMLINGISRKTFRDVYDMGQVAQPEKLRDLPCADLGGHQYPSRLFRILGFLSALSSVEDGVLQAMPGSLTQGCGMIMSENCRYSVFFPHESDAKKAHRRAPCAAPDSAVS